MTGVPKLLNQALNVANVAALLVADAQLFMQMFIRPRRLDKATTVNKITTAWGISYSNLLNAAPALQPTSIAAFDLKKEWNVPNYPMEGGAFQTYNKIKEPYDIRVRMTFSGAPAAQQIFLDTLDALANSQEIDLLTGSLRTIDVFTPYATYTNGSIYKYTYTRTGTSGVGLLIVDAWIAEIRNTIVGKFASVKTDSAASPKPSQVAPQDSNASETAYVDAHLA